MKLTLCFCVLTLTLVCAKVAPEYKPEANLVEPEFVLNYQTVLYKQTESTRIAHIIYAQNDVGQYQMTDCFLTGDVNVAEVLLEEFPIDLTKNVDNSTMNQLIDTCSAFLTERLSSGKFHEYTRNANPQTSLNRGFLESLVIFPGTKWCGPGHVASHYDDLGKSKEADACCRTHDHCQDNIPARGNKYGLKNKAIYTKSHCDCDREFQGCLKNAKTEVANSVGRLYCNLLQVQCFEVNYPIKKCLKYSGWIPWIHWSCQKYELDTNAAKKWQFFDAKYFE